jgi:hypothetical protein
VQEHRFNLPQIKNSLDELGLKFSGFEYKDAISSFREFHGRKADIYDLALWHQYEKSNPVAFLGCTYFGGKSYKNNHPLLASCAKAVNTKLRDLLKSKKLKLAT